MKLTRILQAASSQHRVWKELKDPKLLSAVWHESNKKSFPISDPATGEFIANVADNGAEETKQAINVATETFESWKLLPAKQRSNLLRTWFNLIVDNRDDLGLIMTAENGKPLAEAKGEVVFGASFVEWFAEEAKRAYGDIIPATVAGRKLLALKQPVGPCGLITPWNFPSAMITRKCAAALAAGCSFVLKPAEDTPLSALALAELAYRAGIPKEVFNVVTASRKFTAEVGLELTTNPQIRKISFTGSTAVGKLLMQQSASTVKRLSLELGGNSPFIVFDDADLDAAVNGAIQSKFRNSGQVCISSNRLYVQRGIAAKFTEKLTAKVKSFKVGNGFDPEVNQGPLINNAALKKVNHLVSDAAAKGANILVGGKPHALGRTFFEPTVLNRVSGEMDISRQEIFGPVAALYEFDTEQEVIRLANNSPQGLAGYFYSRDIGRIFRLAEALEVGMVGVNEVGISAECTPFGGIKQSGMGTEGSKYGLNDYLNIKYVCLGGL